MDKKRARINQTAGRPCVSRIRYRWSALWRWVVNTMFMGAEHRPFVTPNGTDVHLAIACQKRFLGFSYSNKRLYNHLHEKIL